MGKGALNPEALLVLGDDEDGLPQMDAFLL